MHLIHRLAPTFKCKLNDMISQATRTEELIRQASTECQMILLEAKIGQIASYYSEVVEMPLWVSNLNRILLLRRCELLALYPEEA